MSDERDQQEPPLVHEPTFGRAEPAARVPAAGSGPIVIVAVIGLLLGGAGAWWWLRDAPAPATPRGSDARLATDAPVTPIGEAARELPPLDQMDTFLRALLGALSNSPELAKWLATDDLIRQMANAIDRVSRGQSPSRDVPVLRPEGAFRTRGTGAAQTIDAESYRRFNGIALLLASLDPQAVADAYRTIQPRLDAAYRGLGRSEGTVHGALLAALDVLIATPIPKGPVRVRPGPGASLVFVDPELEGLAPAQKQLLRMGPEHLAKILPRLRALRAALAAPPV